MGSYGCTPQSLPKFQHPSHELLKENGFTQHVYHKYRRRCLNGKKHKGKGLGQTRGLLLRSRVSVLVELVAFPWPQNKWYDVTARNEVRLRRGSVGVQKAKSSGAQHIPVL